MKVRRILWHFLANLDQKIKCLKRRCGQGGTQCHSWNGFLFKLIICYSMWCVGRLHTVWTNFVLNHDCLVILINYILLTLDYEPKQIYISVSSNCSGWVLFEIVSLTCQIKNYVCSLKFWPGLFSVTHYYPTRVARSEAWWWAFGNRCLWSPEMALHYSSFKLASLQDARFLLEFAQNTKSTR